MSSVCSGMSRITSARMVAEPRDFSTLTRLFPSST